jgi:hypothetical protein
VFSDALSVWRKMMALWTNSPMCGLLSGNTNCSRRCKNLKLEWFLAGIEVKEKLGKGGKPSATGKPSGKGRDNNPPK